MRSLTPKQLELMRYLRGYIDSRGCGPSMDEMRISLGLGSKAGVVRLLKGLEERGLIRRMAYRQRAIEIIEPRSQIGDRETARRILKALRSGGVAITVVNGMSLEPNAIEDIIIRALRDA